MPTASPLACPSDAPKGRLWRTEPRVVPPEVGAGEAETFVGMRRRRGRGARNNHDVTVPPLLPLGAAAMSVLSPAIRSALQVPTPTARAVRTGGRLHSLDAFRGLIMIWLLYVAAPTTWLLSPSADHAAWHGWTIYDLAFPTFIVILGTAIPLACVRRAAYGQSRTGILRHAAGRAAGLVGLGLLLNAFPFVTLTPDLGLHSNLTDLRLPGILQRLGVLYLAGVAFYLYTRPRTWAAVGLSLLGGYAALLVWAPVPGVGAGVLDDPAGTLAAYVDRLVLGTAVLPSGAPESEGLLSTISCLTTVLLGVGVGHALLHEQTPGRTALGLIAAGALLLVGSAAWAPVLPINKTLWTGPFILLTGGLYLVVFGAFHALVQSGWWTRGRSPAEAVGVNALLIYTGSLLVYQGLVPALMGSTPLALRVHFHARETLNLSPEFVLTVASVAFTAVWIGGAWVLYRRRLVVRPTGLARIRPMGASDATPERDTARVAAEETVAAETARRRSVPVWTRYERTESPQRERAS